MTARRTSWTADELMATAFPEPRWAVPGLLAEGLTLLAGAPKLGKSWLALNLSVAVASGGTALGRVEVTEGDVLYLALEDNGRRLQSRLRAVLKGQPAPSRLHLATECEPMPAGAERIARWLAEHHDARLVVVDVFSKVRAAAGASQDRYSADYAAVGDLKRLADEYEVAFLVVHHTRKMTSEDFLDTVSGTQGLAGAADAVAVLARSRGAAEAVLKVTGRDVPEAEHALDFDPPTGTWRLLDGPAEDYEVSDQRRRILAAVRDAEGIGPKQIAERSGVGHDVVKHLVRKMVDEGQLSTTGNGAYFPPASDPTRCEGIHFIHRVHSPPPDGEWGEQSEWVTQGDVPLVVDL